MGIEGIMFPADQRLESCRELEQLYSILKINSIEEKFLWIVKKEMAILYYICPTLYKNHGWHILYRSPQKRYRLALGNNPLPLKLARI